MKKLLAATLCFACVVMSIHAQEFVCSASDERCLQDRYERACRIEDATIASCSSWISALESSNYSAAASIRLSIAASQLALSDLASDSVSSGDYRAQAIAEYRATIENYPNNIQARVGLSALTDDTDERIALLRRVLEIDPNYAFGYQLLSAELRRNPDGLAEAATLMEMAYMVTPDHNDNRARAFAGETVLMYERAGLQSELERFRARVRIDWRTDEYREIAESPRRATSEQAGTALMQLCSKAVLLVLGGDECLTGIASVAAAARDSGQIGAQQYAEAAADAMNAATRYGWRLQNADPNWRSSFEATLKALIEQGYATPLMFQAHALATTDKAKRVESMESAAALAPSDGEIAFGLGLAYADAGRKEEALRSLRIAEQLLPESRRAFIRQQMGLVE